MAYSTQQKMAIQKVLEESREPLKPTDLLFHARKEVPGLGIATVYRFLNALQKEGRVDIVEVPQSSPRYILSKDRCSTYFLCTKCDRLFPLREETQELSSLSLTQFDVSSYQGFFYGACKEKCC
jgi:Fur family ferric uptake transcriptional regulator